MPRMILVAACAAGALVLAAEPAAGQGVKLTVKVKKQQPSRLGKPWLGVNLGQGKYGVKIEAVYRGAPAELAGVERGDEILAIDGERLRSATELIELVGGRRQVGDEIDIKLLRDERILRLEALLGRFPDAEELFRLLKVERPAAELSLPELEGEQRVDLASYRGDVVVLAFVSQSCGRCPAALEALARQARRFGDRGLAVLAITDRPSAAALRQIRRSAARFQLLYDAGRRVWRAWLGARPPEAPVLFVVDRDGIVRWAGRDLDEMRRSVEVALRERNGVDIE